MIIDIEKFITEERPYWQELERTLDACQGDDFQRLDLQQVRRLHYLYERVSSDLAKLSTFAAERETRRHLEALVARAYGEIHEAREKPHRFRPLTWLQVTFPCVFRKHSRAFAFSCVVTSVGSLLGGILLVSAPDAKRILLPYHHLLLHPSERVANEEAADPGHDQLRGRKARGAAWYIQHNTKVGLSTMALGATYGIGTFVMLMINGILLGAVCLDYFIAGEGVFLTAWLLPHGSVEITAILIAGQAGFVLGGTLLGLRQRRHLRDRLRAILPDLATLAGGLALFLAWAGIIEAFLSQYHEPVIPYSVKIAFGTVQLLLVVVYLGRSGRRKAPANVTGADHA